MNIFFFILIIISSLFIINPWVRIILKAIASKKWPPTEGVITKSKFKTEGDGSEYSIWREVEYSYLMKGVEYIGNRISYRITFKNKNWILESNFSSDYKKFQEGQKVKVYYNPQNLKEAVLVPGLTIDLILASIMLILFYISFILIIYRFIIQ
jgi:hypothetical protein